MHQVDLEKDADDGLGLGFTEALFDELRRCNNHCPFCFIDQQPPGHRDSLYLKDDDFRLSFLYPARMLSLTNLTDVDWQHALISSSCLRCMCPCTPLNPLCANGCW